ncbi:MAG: hypothetical protein ALAOOOJD_03922 [bacterium]|nr:hypothetical protein [bacterium]
MRQENFFRIRPFFEARFFALDAVGGAGFDGIAFGQFQRRCQHVFEAQSAKFRQHRQQAARRSRRDRGERAVLRRVVHFLLFEKFRRRACWRHAERIDADDVFRFRIINERLRLAAPTENIPHRANGGKHGAGSIHRIAASLENLRAGSGREGLAGDRHPVFAVQDGFLGLGAAQISGSKGSPQQ